MRGGYTLQSAYSNQIGASNRFDYIVLRGFSDGSPDNVYLDGLKMMGDTTRTVRWWLTALEDIEVVRGPASVPGVDVHRRGIVVALTSRKPAFDAGEVKLFAGNHNQRGRLLM